MKRRPITPATVRMFYSVMAKKFRVKIIYTGDGSHLDELADIVNCVGIPADEFLKRYAFTVGGRIFIPWKPGSRTVSLTSQICILCHELIHSVHARKKGTARWLLLYARRKSYRAHCEAKALHANLEVYYYLTGRKPAIAPMLHSLKAYRLRSSDIGVTHMHLNTIRRAMVKGKGSHQVIKEAIKWWSL